ncbi:14-3-3 protein [Trichomonas vaginalis G3]|uniref:14-3-3 protein n=1 Tax=Trichomonas vaginalis (strain ATCC PRA-98 / G3) TaxID=412133 RepID=A2ECB8_TRIV3|nr:protein domain specific binding [Trichomonas vaginalis G3]EAY09702.1 14-3-3 protein [Trichomonas vaginalis G3]KAI5534023.1 protein domain specific binding [Trichomonas vaginalis G3]|eukprot:XP_001321925.1 14-3-3 protein [Trichomonas vaginalis G3]
MEPRDIVYLAQTENSIDRSGEAIKLMIQLAEVKPNFDQNERQLLVLIYKTAIDPIRETIRTLSMYRDSSKESGQSEQAQMIDDVCQSSIHDLDELCAQGLDLVDKVLLPACQDPAGIAFYQKLRGDFYRYMVEFAKEDKIDEIKKNADSAYSAALQTATEKLPSSNPIRLGVILNYAVFKFEHAEETGAAREMLVSAIQNFSEDSNQLSESSHKEAQNVINVMQKNLVSWSPENPEEETVEEGEE